MSTNFEDLDPESPEYEAALDAAQAEEDAATGNLEAKDSDESTESEAQDAVADGEQTADTAAKTAAESTTTEPAEPAKPAGVASKDGSRVLPYAALQAERRAARSERSQREALQRDLDAVKQQLADLKAGKTVETDSTDDLSDEDIERVGRDFPEVKKVANQLKAVKQQLAKLQPAAAEAAADEPADDPIQEAIDQVPMLLSWQASDPEKFQRAAALDDVLKTSRKWAGKSMAERFAHVTKQVAEEFDIAVDDTPQANSSTPNRANPKDVIARAARAAPNTLSDFKGGATDPQADRLDRMPAAKAVARMDQMTDDEIEAHLAKFGG